MYFYIASNDELRGKISKASCDVTVSDLYVACGSAEPFQLNDTNMINVWLSWAVLRLAGQGGIFHHVSVQRLDDCRCELVQSRPLRPWQYSNVENKTFGEGTFFHLPVGRPSLALKWTNWYRFTICSSSLQ